MPAPEPPPDGLPLGVLDAPTQPLPVGQHRAPSPIQRALDKHGIPEHVQVMIKPVLELVVVLIKTALEIEGWHHGQHPPQH